MTAINDREKAEEARRLARIDELHQTLHEINQLKQLPVEEAIQRADEFECAERLQERENEFTLASSQPIAPLATIHPAVAILGGLNAPHLLPSLRAQSNDALRGFLHDRTRGVNLVRFHTPCAHDCFVDVSSRAADSTRMCMLCMVWSIGGCEVVVQGGARWLDSGGFLSLLLKQGSNAHAREGVLSLHTCAAQRMQLSDANDALLRLIMRIRCCSFTPPYDVRRLVRATSSVHSSPSPGRINPHRVFHV
jgi:hypothetical protein